MIDDILSSTYLLSYSTKHKLNTFEGSALDSFGTTRRDWYPGMGRKMCATSRTVASDGSPSTNSVLDASGGRELYL
jgi:hypothetical protein